MNPEIEARLEGFGIGLVAESPAVSIFMRDGCVAMAGRTPGGGLSLGSTGMMTDNGLAYLVWREGHARLAAKGGDVAKRAFEAMMQMKKIDVAAIEAAVRGA